MFPLRLHAGEKTRGPLLLHELLPRTTQVRGDALLDGDERAEVAGKPHLAHHPSEEITQEGRIEPRSELRDERRVARHRLGHDDVRAAYGRPLRRRNAKVLPRPLGA